MSEAAAAAARSRTTGGHNFTAVSEAPEALRPAWGDVCLPGHGAEGDRVAQRHGPGTGILRAEFPGGPRKRLGGASGATP